MISRKKLIEVALPLDAINKAAAREKSIRHGHPSTLHLWWARRPLAAARAVIFAQMVDDPSAHPDRFPTEEAQEEERQRLFRIIEELVKWENTTNQKVLQQAQEEIWQSWRAACADNADHPQAKELFDPDKLPAFHDPFAGGGTLPLEAQRLGLEAYASDLNPVAVLICKAMLEIPPKFAGQPPVNPEARKDKNLFAREWRGAQGLAEDVRYYGKWMRDEAEKRIGHLYPKIEMTAEMVQERPDLKKYVGRKLTVIAWLWARTVKSPNPAFAHVDVPLASTFMLSTKKGKEAYVEPVIYDGSYRFTVQVGKPKDEAAAKSGTKLSRGANFRCLMSGTPIAGDYIKAEGKAGRMGARLMAIVAEGDRGRVYLAPVPEHEVAARKAEPEWKPEGDAPARLTGGTCVPYGLTAWGDLFTPRQLVALTTFSDLVQEARERIKRDYLGARASGPHNAFHRAWHSRGYHPHLDAAGLVQSITFRLVDSVPQLLLQQWREELRVGAETRVDDPHMVELRERIARYEDAGHGGCYLRQPEIARLVQRALLHFDGERYRLLQWCIMPNHVHALIEQAPGHRLADVVQSWKSFTSKQANRLLGRSGAFWMPDYFDRFVRNEQHFHAVRRYIRENPVQAGLCARAEDWPWSSATVRFAADDAGETPAHPGDEISPRDGGIGAAVYVEAVEVYLAFAISKAADRNTSLCVWEQKMDRLRGTFGRQALPMVWDYAETNPFAGAGGDIYGTAHSLSEVLDKFTSEIVGRGVQNDAQTQSLSQNRLVSTDPPYYDNIGYADLSDFFYVWLRQSLRPIFSNLFTTLACPRPKS